MTVTAAPTTPAALRAATTATYAAFAGSGFAFASWAARIPQVHDRLDLDPAALGLVLLAIAAGSLLALPLSGPVVSRIGSARTVMANGLTELQLVHHLDPADEVGAYGPGWEYYLDMLVAARDDLPRPSVEDKAEQDDFQAYVAARMARWRSSAYLMCEDWHTPDDLVSVTLAKLFRN